MTLSFGYYNYTPAAPLNLPLVITAPAEKGYEGEFIHYSPEEINDHREAGEGHVSAAVEPRRRAWISWEKEEGVMSRF